MKMSLEIIAEKRSKKYILENIGKYYITNFIVFLLLLLKKMLYFEKDVGYNNYMFALICTKL